MALAKGVSISLAWARSNLCWLLAKVIQWYSSEWHTSRCVQLEHAQSVEEGRAPPVRDEPCRLLVTLGHQLGEGALRSFGEGHHEQSVDVVQVQIGLGHFLLG
eukprot:CAMPEP_0173203656 /NCGR_PEP_ID=MMETSP1141-20130122/19648_1 /TAXON_ID=483371 /ORGANISM="non described non described, Strain CCMP2298" /LENGTH=102 /DNA_ID=CAMNT_0014129153 /DNA_START=414 /DNA_END=722 /DNA_ORIENTATION=-